MLYENLIVEIREKDKMGKVVINKPKRMNALDLSTLLEIQDALDLLTKDSKVRVIVLTGAGEKAFVAGADIKELVKMEPMDYYRFSQALMGTVQKVIGLEKPVIAAVNGVAYGGGLTLARACDLVIASTNAKFSQPEINLGFYGGAFGMHKYIGKARTYELVLLGESIGADIAEQWGLVNWVVPPNELEVEVLRIVHKLIEKSPLALRAAKENLRVSLEERMDTSGDYQTNLVSILFLSEDVKQGVRAFLEKRRANYRNA